MKYCKIIFLLSLLFLLISCRPSIEKNEDNEKITNENSLKKYEYNRNDIRDIERVIKVLITDKKKSYQTNQSELKIYRREILSNEFDVSQNQSLITILNKKFLKIISLIIQDTSILN